MKEYQKRRKFLFKNILDNDRITSPQCAKLLDIKLDRASMMLRSMCSNGWLTKTWYKHAYIYKPSKLLIEKYDTYPGETNDDEEDDDNEEQEDEQESDDEEDDVWF